MFLSLIGIGYGTRSYLHVRDTFGDDASERFLSDLWWQIAAAIVINAIVALIIHFHVTKPMNCINEIMRLLTKNKIDIDIPYTDRKDQIGSAARKVVVFKQNAKALAEAQQKNIINEKLSLEEKYKVMDRLAFTFENGIREVVAGVSGSASELHHTSASLSTIAVASKGQAQTLGNASCQALDSVNVVADSEKKLAASIKSIIDGFVLSRNIANDAVQKGKDAKSTFGALVVSTEEIGTIMKLIVNIAGQINLLALNATIEAARAGDAGKGFSVVANEVKNLAAEAAKATEEIGKQINKINEKTENTEDALEEIIKTIDHMNAITNTNSIAMEEQSAVTQEIANRIKIAEKNTHAVQDAVTEILESSTKVEIASEQLIKLNKSLDQHSSGLNKKVKEFLTNIKDTTMQLNEVPEYTKGHEIITLSPADTVSNAIGLFSKYNIGVLPVVTDGKVVGVFSERDALKEVIGRNINKEATRISEVMTDNPATTLPTQEVLSAIFLTITSGSRHLLIADENKKLLSVLSHRDLGSILWKELRKHKADLDYTLEDMVKLKEVNELKTISSKSSIKDAAGLMIAGNFGAVPILDNKKLLGVITERDIVQKILHKNLPYTNMQVIDVMSDHPETVSPKTSLRAIADSGVFKKCGHLLVVNEKGHTPEIKGILSLGDFIKIPYGILQDKITNQA